MRSSNSYDSFEGGTRFGEISKLIPVLVVVKIILFLYIEYVFLHGFRLLQTDIPVGARDNALVTQGIWQISVFHCVTALLMYCFGKCLLCFPGTIPDGKGWELMSRQEREAKGNEMALDLKEKKHSGERRHCKWCLKYKPDRCHHCRICNICVLRMDHHCPWVYNCIGFRNHKYFFLLLIYAAIDLLFIVSTMFDSVWWSTRVDISVSMMVALAFGESLACFLSVITVIFLGFHIWLMTKAMTTVEFCEKSLKKASYNSSIYSQGVYANICAVLGPQPLLWFVPISLPEGDGLSWGEADKAAAPSSTQSFQRTSIRASLR
jgi:palmitoyltransferase ZDHHC2/15/20